MINTNTIVKIQDKIEHNQASIRSTLGTVIKNTATDGVIYTPPQEKSEILKHMKNLEDYINTDDDMVDPLIKLAIIHHQFESIHPFYNGNGRIGRIINILYLILKDLIDTPILYLSKYIIRNKMEYYKLFQETRETENFKDWIIYILDGIEEMADEIIGIINRIRDEIVNMKHELKEKTKIYSKELLEELFFEFYIKNPYIQEQLRIATSLIY